MKKILLFIIIISSSMAMNGQKDDYLVDSGKIDQLIEAMTLEEKVSLCSGRDDWSTSPVERLGIPWIWLSDGPHGLRRAPATNKAGYGDQLPASCFPTASALAATWDKDLIFQLGQTLGDECHALDVNILLGPGVNIKRSVLGGRNFEYYSEDPVLSGEMGAAFINGVQSRGIGTSLKHFVANNVETMRMYMNSDLDQRSLHEIYLRPFEIAVKKAKPWTVMACYNRVQGTYGTQNPYMLRQILKDDWGYEGIVISDWFAVVDKTEAHRAGLHLEMPHANDINDRILAESVRQGKLDESILDDRVREILQIVFRAKAMEKQDNSFDENAHHAFARKVASEAATLLKNDHNILPVTRSKYAKVALIGEFAENPRFQGNGSSEVKPTRLDRALDEITKDYGHEFEIAFARGYDLKDDLDLSYVQEAVELARKCDIALVFAGLPLHYESEGIDRTHIDLPAAHNQLIRAVAEVQSNTVVVLTNGSAVSMPWIDEVPAVLEAWLGGQAGGGAMADVLFGRVNPSGKLAETFPISLKDSPASFNFPGEQGNVWYGERIFVGYRYYDEKGIKPLFPFGHGLSYTTFEYSDLSVSSEEFTDKDKLIVTMKIRNTGSVRGKEVVQLYVSDPESRLQRPEKELKHFTKISLEPGEQKELSFELNERDFACYDPKRERWIAESGEYQLWLGSSSRDIRLRKKLQLHSTQQVPVAFDEFTFFREYWDHPQTRELLKKMLPNYINQHVPEGKTMDEAKFQDFFIDQPMIKFPYIANGEITHAQVMQLVEKCRDIYFIP